MGRGRGAVEKPQDFGGVMKKLVPPPKKKVPPVMRIKVITAQRNTCVSPTKPIPIILPIIKSKGLTDEIIISMIRFVFSSITPCMTIPP